MAYPTSLDTFPDAATLALETLATSPHSTLHGNLGDAIEALEAKVGIDSSAVATSLDYIVTNNLQPKDSDLTAIAALTTTSYGRALLELANQAALMALLSAATTSASGIAELATTAETSTGTDTGRVVTPDGLAGSIFGTVVVSIQVTDPNGDALTTGDGKAYFRVPSTVNGMDLVGVAAHVTTVSSSGTPTIQIANVTDTVDMLSTKITIDANEKDSSTAATPAVIDTSKDDVVTGDELRIDVDVAGTGAKGLIVELQFRLP